MVVVMVDAKTMLFSSPSSQIHVTIHSNSRRRIDASTYHSDLYKYPRLCGSTSEEWGHLLVNRRGMR